LNYVQLDICTQLCHYGDMLQANVFDFRKNLAGYLDEVETNKRKVVIKRFGRTVAIVLPYDAKDEADGNKYFGFMGEGESGEQFLKRVRRSEKALERTKKLRRGDA
jgi:hypothetical protein